MSAPTPTSSAPTGSRRSDPPVSTERDPQYSLAKRVFAVTATIVAIAVAFALILPDAFNDVISTLNSTVVDTIGW